MKLSARNQPSGTVKRVNEGAAIANVELDVNGQRVVTSITVSGPLLGGHGGVESRSTP
jgi:molybdopterin-binding protein